MRLNEFDALVRSELGKPSEQIDLFVVDEIGKMECFSRVFIEATAKVLDGPVPVLATIAAKGSGFIAKARTRADIRLLSVSPSNRDELPGELAGWLRAK